MESLDIAVVSVVAVSALFAFIRGFTREVLSIVAWLGAAAVAFYWGPFVRDKAEAMMPTSRPWVENLALGHVAVFIVAVIFFSLLVGIVAAQVRRTALGPLDRALGLLFGVARGALIICLVYLVGSHMVKPQDTPEWVQKARSRPLMEAGALQLKELLPKSISEFQDATKSAADTAKNVLQTGQAVDAVNNLMAPPPIKQTQKQADPANPEANSDKKAMDQAVQAIQASDK